MKPIVIILLLFTSQCFAVSLKDTSYGSVIVSEITSIYDADTFRVNINEWPDIVGQRMSVRVNGIDAPEIRGKCKEEKRLARLAKQFTVELLRSGKVIELRNIKRGKYFRLLADVYIDNKSLSKALIKNNHARLYNDGTKSNWCG